MLAFFGTIQASGGTLDGGGANGIKLRLIESNKMNDDFPKLKFISPFVAFLNKTQSSNKLSINLNNYSNAIENLLKKKMWLIIPVKGGIKDIGTIIHGIPFSTDQFAIQTTDDVFIDKNVYDNMIGDLEVEREKLILHEIFMGLKILLKQDEYLQCNYTKYESNSNKISDYCSHLSYEKNRNNNQELNLTPKDHSDVRFLTDLVVENSKNFENSEKYEELISIFTNAFYERNFISKQLLPYRNWDSVDVSASALLKLIKGQELINQTELYCNHFSEMWSYSKSQMEEFQKKLRELPKGNELTFNYKFKIKISAEDREGVFLIKVLNAYGKSLQEIKIPKESNIRGHRISPDFNVNIYSNEGSIVEYWLKEEKYPKKFGDKNEVVTMEINTITKEIKRLQNADTVTYSLDEKATTSKWNMKMECIEKEVFKYKN